MTATTSPAATIAATPKQLETIADLTAELGYDNVPAPTSRDHASAIIRRLIEDRDARGQQPAPTSRQLRLLAKLAAERGKTYATPRTRKQAAARIQQILAAGKAAQDQAPEEAPVAA